MGASERRSNVLRTVISHQEMLYPKLTYVVFASVLPLAIFSLAGREGRIESTRELVIPKFPYIVVYQTAKEIRILAVLHTSRKWPSIF